MERIPAKPGTKTEVRSDGGMISSFCKCHAPLTSRNKKLVCWSCKGAFCQGCEDKFRGGNHRGTGDPLLCEDCYKKMMAEREAGIKTVIETPKETAAPIDASPLGGSRYPDFEAANTFYRHGKSFLDAGDVEKALACFQRALSNFGDSADAWYGKGLALLRMGRPAEAAEALARADMLRHNDPEVANSLGEALLGAGKRDAAIQQFDRVIGLRSDFARAYLNKGIALMALARYEPALICFDEALSREPANIEAWRGKGHALEKLGRIDEADAALAQANRKK
jgi:tetratricopeptide (TPR) repeat protein